MDLHQQSKFEFTEFYQMLDSKVFGKQVWMFNELDSTNTFVKQRSEQITPHGLVCLTRYQTNGRGQHDKVWYAESDKCLTFSIVLKPQYANRLQLLVQVAALSVLEVLENHYKITGEIKWPNDVLIKGKKVAGILAEGIFNGSKLDRFIIGIGVNLFDGNFLKKFTEFDCVETNTTKPLKLNVFLAQLINQFEKNYQKWMESDTEIVKTINHSIIGFCKWNKVEVNGHFKDELFKFLGLNTEGYPVFITQSDEIKKVTHQNIRLFPTDAER